MDLVVVVALAVLALVFVGSLFALIVICRHRHRMRNETDKKPIFKYSREQLDSPCNGIESELDDVLQLSPNIAKILRNNTWMYDASELVQRCLSILKLCHQISDKLSALSFSPVSNTQTQNESMEQVRLATRRVMPRVDDLVRSMYVGGRAGSTTALLLEARAAALMMALSSLMTAFRAAHHRNSNLSDADALWLKSIVGEMDGHLETLRLAAIQEELTLLERVEIVLDPVQEIDGHQEENNPCVSPTDPCHSEHSPPSDPQIGVDSSFL